MKKVYPVFDPRQRQASKHTHVYDLPDWKNPANRAPSGKARLAIGLLPLIMVLLSSCSGINIPGEVQRSTRFISEASREISGVFLKPSPTDMHPALTNKQDTQVAMRINDLFIRLAAQEQFSGSVLIAKSSQILLAQGYSMANQATQIPNDLQTRFYLGSVTKEFTAMAILLLQQQGKLRVQDSICSYITPCPSSWQPVTLHHILTHTSGIPELDTSELSNTSPSAWIASFNDSPLSFEPGSNFSYCSVCYQILAYVVQVVSGQPYQQFMQNTIFTPLHMTETGFDASFYYSQVDDAHGYTTWQNEAGRLGWNIAPTWSFLFGSGLLYSTIGDLYLWDQALYTNVLATQQTLNTAFTPYTSNSLFAGSTYGYGWFITTSPVANHRLVWHDGVIDGFRTYIGRYLDDNITIIFLSNLATVDSPTLAQSIQALIFT